MDGVPPFTLCALEPADFQDWWEIRSCPGVVRETLSLPFMSKAQAERKLANPPDDLHTIVAEVEGKVVGQCRLRAGRGRRAHVGSLGMMVHDDYTGRGIGTALLSAIIDMGEKWLGLSRLELEVFTDNEAAIHLYRKPGFTVEGTKHHYALCDGVYVDALVMAWIKADQER